MDIVAATRSHVVVGTSTSAAAYTTRFDVIGYDAASIDVHYVPTIAGAPASIALTHGADGTTFATFSGLSYTLVTAATTGGTYRFEVPTKDLERWIRVSTTSGTAAGTNGWTVAVAARLHKGVQGPANASDKNVLNDVVRTS